MTGREVIELIEASGRSISLFLEESGLPGIRVSHGSSLTQHHIDLVRANREAVIAYLIERDGEPTPYAHYEIDRAVERFEKAHGSKLSRDTMYRAIRILTEKGLKDGYASPEDCDAAVAQAVKEEYRSDENTW